MQYTIIAAVLAAVFCVAPVVAIDYREKYIIPGTDGAAFCKTWKCDCINYTPKTAITFQEAYCEPNIDHNAKKVYAFCAFKNSSGQVTTVDKHIASETGATPTS